jgi:hypothetical protein
MKFRNGNSFIAAAIGFVAASVAFAQNVTVELKNGDRVTGRIISETTNSVVLSNAWAREITLPLADIAKRTTITNVPVIAASTNKLATNAVALAKIVASTNRLFTSPMLKYWHGELQVGADLTFSERDRQVYNAKAKLLYAKDRFKAAIDYDMTYGRSEVDQAIPGTSNTPPRVVRRTETDANRMNGSVKFDYDLNKRIYIYNLAAAGYDEIRKIDLRYEIGPGVGYHLFARTNFFANVETGFNYQDEEHTDDTSVDTFFFRFAENAAWKITPRLTWDEKFEYFPRVEELGQYHMRFETNLRYAMLQNIYLNVSLVDIYDSEPAGGVAQNDLQVRSSVGVKF